MRPSRPSAGKADLFRERLDNIINSRHALVRLTGVVPIVIGVWLVMRPGRRRPEGAPAHEAGPASRFG